jgi:hypothetical protein
MFIFKLSKRNPNEKAVCAVVIFARFFNSCVLYGTASNLGLRARCRCSEVWYVGIVSEEASPSGQVRAEMREE